MANVSAIPASSRSVGSRTGQPRGGPEHLLQVLCGRFGGGLGADAGARVDGEGPDECSGIAVGGSACRVHHSSMVFRNVEIMAGRESHVNDRQLPGPAPQDELPRVLAELFRAGPDAGTRGGPPGRSPNSRRRVGLTRPTVEAALTDLVAEGWVEELKAVATPNSAGRRARRFRVDARSGRCSAWTSACTAWSACSPTCTVTRSRPHRGVLPGPGPSSRPWTASARSSTAWRHPPPGRLLAVTSASPRSWTAPAASCYSVAAPEWRERRHTDRIAALVPDAVTSSRTTRRPPPAPRRLGAPARRPRRPAPGDGATDRRGLGGRRRGGQGAHGAAGEVGGMAATGWPEAARALEARTGSGADLAVSRRR